MKFKARYLLSLLVVFFMVSAGLAEAAGSGAKLSVSKQDIKRMSVFLSNFTEQGMMNIPDVSALTDAELVHFGVWHNYINNSKRIKNTSSHKLSLDAKIVAESVKKYFAIELKKTSFKSVNYFGQIFAYDGKNYIFDGADGDINPHAKVTEVYRAGNNLLMKGKLYNPEDPGEIQGTFKAYAKPWRYNGKDTWALISLTTEN